MDIVLPTKENIQALLRQQLQAERRQPAVQEDQTTSEDVSLDDLRLVWLSDIQDELCAEPKPVELGALTRRQLFGPLLGATHSQELHTVEQMQTGKKKVVALGAIASVCLGVGAYTMLVRDAETDAMQQAVVTVGANTNDYEPTLPRYQTTTTATKQSDIQLQSVPTPVVYPEVSTATSVAVSSTETVPVTTSLETLPVAIPTEQVAETIPVTVPEVAEVAPPETAPATTANIYAGVECSAASTVIIRGMTPSELAGRCGLSVETLQSYNTFNVLTQFITGTTVYLQPRQALAEQSFYKTCPEWFGKRLVIEPNFTVYAYLVSLGVTNPNYVLSQTTLLKDYNLQNIVAGTNVCVPSLEALRVRYGVR